jgi:hypothetical protein
MTVRTPWPRLGTGSRRYGRGLFEQGGDAVGVGRGRSVAGVMELGGEAGYQGGRGWAVTAGGGEGQGDAPNQHLRVGFERHPTAPVCYRRLTGDGWQGRR